MKKILVILLAFLTVFIKGKAPEEIDQLKEGNLALPASQQISPLFSFGQNVIGEDVLQAYTYLSWIKGKDNKNTIAVPGILFGATEDLSIFFNIPVFINNESNKDKSSGIGDVFAQFEYALWIKESYTSIDTWTGLFNVILPTGDDRKKPNTGLGRPSFFLGTTYSHLAVDWYVYTSYGAILTMKNDSNKSGNSYLYQFGFGKNIPTSPDWVLTWVLEFNGFYNQSDEILGIINSDSGGNTIFIGPSIWLSTEKTIFQIGVSFPAYQCLVGNQNKNDYWFAMNFGYTF